VGDVIRLEVSGTTLKAFVNDVQKGSDVTDATFSSGRVGVKGNYTGGTYVVHDDYSGGNFPASCTPATITRASNVTANLGDAGRIGHVTTGTADSIKIIATNADSVAMLDPPAGDTVAHRGKVKGRFYIGLAQFSCASKDSAYCKDSLIVVGDSVRYANRIDTAHISTYFDPTNAFLMSDSVTVKSGMPPGGTLTKSGANLGRVTLTTPTDTGHYTPTFICWNNGFKVDSGSFNITIIYGTIKIDSVAPDTIVSGDSATIYGRNWGPYADSVHATMGGSAVTVLSCTNDTMRVIIPTGLAVGFYNLIIHDGTSDTLDSAFYVESIESCSLTVATTTGGTVSPEGLQVYDCADSVEIAATAAGGGYSFASWSCVGAEVVNAFEATTKAYLTSGSGSVTAQFTCTGATIAYTPTTYVCTVGVALIPLLPVIAGDYTAVTVSPPLPAGISMSSVTGAITGTPTTASGATNYVFSFSGNCNPGSDTINISTLLIKDTMVSCYPRKVRSDVTASLRIITMKYHGIFKATESTIVHLGSVSLGPNAAHTDSTVTDTVSGCPSGYYRGFLTDPAYTDMSDTVLNVLQVLTPTGTVTNPR
jgi:hypothetical protein